MTFIQPLGMNATAAARLDIAVAYLPGAHGGWGSDPEQFAERLHGILQEV